ncbi:MAG: MFS transporter [Erysipelotrichaceae bacterium]|nr:MFS transporter [Erysipelotrichaceae bacterium]
MKKTMDKNSNLKYLIIILALCGIAASSTGVTFNSAGVFYGPVSEALNVKQGTFSFYQTLASFTSAILTIYTARKVNNQNFKKYILFGTVLTGLATCAMAFCTQVFQFYVIGILLGIGKAYYVGVLINVVINNWFISYHGLITGFVMAFTGIAGTICSPIFSSMIEAVGWNYAYLIMGISIFALNSIAIIYPFSLAPQDEGSMPYLIVEKEDKQQLYKKSEVKIIHCDKIMLICLVVIGCLTAGNTTLPQHFPSYLVSLGHSAQVGALAVSMCLVGNIVFKLIAGVLADMFGPLKVIVFMMVINFISIAMMLSKINVAVLLSGAFLFGSIYAVSAVGVTLVIKERFGLEQYKQIVPVTSLFSSTGLALFISLFGYVYDFTKSFTFDFVIVIVFQIVILTLLIVIYQKKERKEV